MYIEAVLVETWTTDVSAFKDFIRLMSVWRYYQTTKRLSTDAGMFAAASRIFSPPINV